MNFVDCDTVTLKASNVDKASITRRVTLSQPRPRPTAMASNNSSSDRSDRLREAVGPIHHLSDEAFNSLLLRLNDWVTSQDIQQHTVTEVFSDNTNLASAFSSMTGGSADDGRQVLETPDIVGGVNSSNSYSSQPQEPSSAGSTPSLVLSEQRSLEDSSTTTDDSSTTTGSTPIFPGIHNRQEYILLQA